MNDLAEFFIKKTHKRIKNKSQTPRKRKFKIRQTDVVYYAEEKSNMKI